MLLSDAAELYMQNKTRKLRPNTIEGYASALRVHVLPAFGSAEMSRVARSDVQAWIDSFDLPGAALKAYKTLRQVVRWCIRVLGMEVPDPTVGVELPSLPRRRPRVLDAPGLRAYLRALWGHPCEAAAVCAAALGLRRGEAMGLRWEDVNLSTGEVRIRRSRQVVAGEVVEVPPKTARSERSCWLPRFAVARLRQLRRGARGPLCPMRPDAAARSVRSACRRAGEPWVPWASLRHTWATLAVEAGVGIETVALMLGHSGISTAYEHYIVPRAAICRDAQRSVERLIMRA